MKKTIINCVATMLISGMLYSTANAQGIAMNNKEKQTEEYASGKEQAGEAKKLGEVNSKILRSFYKSYGEQPDATWSKTDNGFAVSFKNDDVKTNVYYKNNGSEEYKINYYSEDQMPADIRHIIKSNFYDYAITQVSEVHKNNSLGYYVKVEDKYSIKTVRVMNEEWEVTETLVKR